MNRSMFPGRGCFIHAIFTGILVLLMPGPTGAYVASPVTGGSIAAELFHREHPFASSRSQLSSQPAVGLAERLGNDGKWSAARAQTLLSRRRSLTSTHQTQRPVTWETTVNNEAPAEYLMKISLGTPAQEFLAVADTGSDLTWIQCAPCEICFNQTAPVFDPSRSSTYYNLSCSSTACQSFLEQYGNQTVNSCEPSCGYTYSYGDDSNTTGTFSTETITLKSVNGSLVKVPEFWFGCSHASISPSALFNASDGLVGLGQGLISLPSQLGDNFDDKFAYCLVNRSTASVESSLLVFGRDAARGELLQYTPFLNNSDFPFFYYVGVEGITVDGVSVDYNTSSLQLDELGNGGTIVDSGTTYSSLDRRAFAPLIETIDARVGGRFKRVRLDGDLAFLELCYNVTEHDDYGSELPVIGLELLNATRWDFKAENAWVQLNNVPAEGTDIVCLTITRGSEGSISIIGNTQQQDFFLLYDRVDQRLGLAPADCSAMAK